MASYYMTDYVIPELSESSLGFKSTQTPTCFKNKAMTIINGRVYNVDNTMKRKETIKK